jgi:hypothetical protein
MQIYAVVPDIRQIQRQQKGRTQEYTMTHEVDDFVKIQKTRANPENAKSRKRTQAADEANAEEVIQKTPRIEDGAY